MTLNSRRFVFNLGRSYGWPLYRCLGAFLWGGQRMLKDGRPANPVQQFMHAFPGKCPICAFHRYGIREGHVKPGVPVSPHEGCPESPKRSAP